jgi:hypothetical protein
MISLLDRLRAKVDRDFAKFVHTDWIILQYEAIKEIETLQSERDALAAELERVRSMPKLQPNLNAPDKDIADAAGIVRFYGHRDLGDRLVMVAEAMQQAELERVKGQEPVAWQIRIGDSPDWGWSDTESDADFYGKQSGLRYEKRPLYTTPPAQPATIEYVDAREKDPARIATVFANAFNAPLVQPAQEPLFWYRPCAGGMYEGPVHHKSIGGKMMRDQKPSEWKPLYTTPPAQPAQPEQTCSACGDVLVGDKLDGALCCDCAYRPAEQGWMRVIDEEMVGAHLGVAHPADSYDEAKQKLKSLICWHVSVATNSAPTENKP